MSEELANTNQNTALAPIDDALFNSLTSSADYFSRLQLMTSNSNISQEQNIPAGNYVVIKTKQAVKDIGKEIDVLVCGIRFKAMRINGDNIISIYNPSNPEFNKIKEESTIKDSGCLCGPEFLVWIPDTKEFATLFCANRSHKSVAPNIRAAMTDGSPGPVTLKSNFVKKQQYRWFAPVVTGCATPFEMPTSEALIENIDKFNHPKDSEIEAASEGEQSNRAR